MTKINLDDVTSGLNSTSALNNNFSDIEDEFNNKVLYRDNPAGEANQMENELDMNGNTITNLPTPASNSEAANKKYVDDVATGAATPAANGNFDSVTTDTIDEKTTDAGVTIETILVKDGDITMPTGDITCDNITVNTQASVDTIAEKTSGSGVTIDGVLLKDGTFTADSISVDTVAEKTAANGVNIDGVLNKDGTIRIGDGDVVSTDALSISSTSGAQLGVVRTSNDTNDADISLRKARGSAGAQTVVNVADPVGTVFFSGYDGTNFQPYGAIQTVVVDNALGSEDGKMTFNAARAGTLTNLVTLAGGGSTPGFKPTSGQSVELGDTDQPWVKTYSKQLEINDGAGTVKMLLNSDGRLIFNGSSSLVTGQGFEHEIQVNGETGESSTISLARASTDTAGTFLSANKARGTLDSPLIAVDGDRILTFSAHAHNGTDWDNQAANIRFSLDGTVTPGSSFMPGKIEIFQGNSGTKTITFESNNYVTLSKGITHAVYTDGTRPAASSVPAGTQIWNSSDNAPNYSDGTNWRDAAGVIT